jgi:hypothetical protein
MVIIAPGVTSDDPHPRPLPHLGQGSDVIVHPHDHDGARTGQQLAHIGAACDGIGSNEITHRAVIAVCEPVHIANMRL